MTDRIVPSVAPARVHQPGASPDESRIGGARPERHGHGPSQGSFGDVLRDAMRSISAGQARVDRAVRRGARGETDPGKLLALQAGVYRYTQELELASKLVDKATSAVKTTLQSQQ